MITPSRAYRQRACRAPCGPPARRAQRTRPNTISVVPMSYELARVGLDLVLEHQPEIEIGIVPTMMYQPSRARASPRAPGRAGAQPGAGDVPQIVAEVEQDGGHRPELDDRGEGGAGVVPAGERGHEAQVRGGGDRQELGEALHDAQDDGLKGVHVGGQPRRWARAPEPRRAARRRGTRGTGGGRGRGSRPSRCAAARAGAGAAAISVCSRVWVM